MAKSIDEVLARARASLQRVSPEAAAALLEDGDALLVDIRPVEQRDATGTVPGALVIDRNVLEWRLDPDGDYRIAELASAHQTVVLMCQQGYASSLAAAALQELGLVNATDLDGGFDAWLAAGLANLK